MKRIILILLIPVLCFAGVTITESSSSTLKKITFAWYSNASGAASGATTARYTGVVARVIFDPDGTDIPSDNYDVVINDQNSYDILNGRGANRDSVTNTYIDSSFSAIVNSKLTISVTNGGALKRGQVFIYISPDSYGATYTTNVPDDTTLQDVADRLRIKDGGVSWDKLADAVQDSIRATGSGSGDITGVTASDGLTGGGTSGTVTLKVDSTEIATQYDIAAMGDITGIIASDRLTGGGTSGTVTLKVDTTATGVATKYDIATMGDITGVTVTAPLSGGGTSGAVSVSADTSTGAAKLATQYFVTSKNYLTAETGDISAVTAGDLLSGGGTSGAVTLNGDSTKIATQYDIALKQDVADTSAKDATRYWVGQQAYLTVETGDISAVTAGAGLTGGGTSGGVTVTLDTTLAATQYDLTLVAPDSADWATQYDLLGVTPDSADWATQYDIALKQDVADTSAKDATRYWVGQQAYLTAEVGDISGVTATAPLSGGGTTGAITVGADTSAGATHLPTQYQLAQSIDDSLARYTTADLLDTTNLDSSQFGKFVRDHESSPDGVGMLAAALTDSLDAYRTLFKLDTTKIDTSQFGQFVRDHESSPDGVGVSTSALTDSLDAYRTAYKLDTTKVDTSQWGKFVRDHESSPDGVGILAAALTDSLDAYRTAYKLDTTKVDTSQWGKFVRDHEASPDGVGVLAAALTDSLDAYRTSFKLDTTKIDTAMWGKFSRDHNAGTAASQWTTSGSDIYYYTGDTKVAELVDSLNVKMFGAVGDGVTDDLVSIQAAVDYASTNKSKLFFPTGTYIVSDSVRLKSDNHIYGNKYNTIIKLKNSVGGKIFYAASDSNIIVESMTIDGNRANQDTIEAIYNYGNEYSEEGVRFYQCNKVSVINCVVKNTLSNGIHIVGCNDVLVDKNYITNCGRETTWGYDSKGIDLNTRAVSSSPPTWFKNWAVTNNTIVQPDSTGSPIQVSAMAIPPGTSNNYVENVRISNNHITLPPAWGSYNNSGNGITAYIDGGCNGYGLVVSDNIVACSDTSGDSDISGYLLPFSIVGWDNVTITGNTIAFCPEYTMEINGTNITISGNSFYKSGQMALIVSANQTPSMGNSINVTGNTFSYGVQFRDIRITNTQGDLESLNISDNIFYGAGDSEHAHRAIYVDSDTANYTMRNVHISNNLFYHLTSNYIEFLAGNNIDNMTISGNTFKHKFDGSTTCNGILFSQRANTDVVRNVFITNNSFDSTRWGNAIRFVAEPENVTISNNTFRACDRGIYFVNGGAYLAITNNVFSEADTAIVLDDGTEDAPTNVSLINNVFQATVTAKYRIASGVTYKPTWSRGNMIYSAAVGIGTASEPNRTLTIDNSDNALGSTIGFKLSDDEHWQLYPQNYASSGIGLKFEATDSSKTITMTQQGGIDIPGNVGIGTTSPTERFKVDTGGGLFSDSLSVGTSGVYVRDMQYVSADSSIGSIFYNTTLARLDTVYQFQQDMSGGGGAGDIEGVTAGFGLNDGGTSGTVTLNADSTELITPYALVTAIDDSTDQFVQSTITTKSNGTTSFGTIDAAADTAAMVNINPGSDISGLRVNDESGNYGLLVNKDGQVNVYKTSPASNDILFQVATSDDASRFAVDEDGDVTCDGQINSGSGRSIVTGSNFYGGDGTYFYTNTGSALFAGEDNVTVYCDQNNNDATSYIAFGTNSASEWARFSPTGNFGINTTDPGLWELYVNGDAYVADTLWYLVAVDGTEWPVESPDILRGISGKDGKLDHETLPTSLVVERKENRWRRLADGFEMDREWHPVMELHTAGYYMPDSVAYPDSIVYIPASTKDDSANFVGNYESFVKTIKGRDVSKTISLLTQAAQREFANTDSVKKSWDFKRNVLKPDTLIIGAPDSSYHAPFTLSDGQAYSRMLPGDATARVSSSKYKKKDIEDVTIDAAAMVNVKAKTYKYDDGTETHAGFVAEEINPLIGAAGTDEVDFNRVITALWEIVRQQQVEIQALKLKIK